MTGRNAVLAPFRVLREVSEGRLEGKAFIIV